MARNIRVLFRFSLFLSPHLERFPVGEGLVRGLHEAEEQMLHEVVGGLRLEEEVHEDFEPGEVDILKWKSCFITCFPEAVKFGPEVEIGGKSQHVSLNRNVSAMGPNP